MKHLTTPEFTKLFDEYPLYSQEQNKDPLIIAKLFDAFGSATWFLTEFNPDDNTAFCYVTGLSYDEWGYVSLTELEEIKHKTFGIPRIERDLYFTPTNFSRVVN
ncbi:MAG: DUF2958 domain-containing protein [Gammaproteobacteria bacterium]|nr:DUF2958 domain-containing protein [Gammaproteobacteria bacterium]